jgi:hypothetical protein
MITTLLYRRDRETEEEFAIACALAKENSVDVVELRSAVPENSLVVGRYSVLPFYRELEADLASKGSRLVNSFKEHDWIASFDWYHYLKEYTPMTWHEREFQYCKSNGPFVVKGACNSRKQQWSTHMYAEDRKALSNVASLLANDPLIGPQGLIYREFVPLKEIERCHIYNQPFVNEWRFFFHKETLLSYGYYWTNCSTPEKFSITTEAIDLAKHVASICAEHTTFFVLDLAEKAAGGWILIEVNDGQCSGLSDNTAETLYSNLLKCVTK